MSGIIAIGAGDEQTCAMKANGELYCWGSNEHGDITMAPHVCGGSDGGAIPCAKSPVRVTAF